MTASVMARVKAHYSERLRQLHIVEVPEWADPDTGEPLRIHVRPMTLVEQDQIYKHISKGSLEALVEALILRARDVDGRHLFKRADRTELLREADAAVILRVVNEMNADADITLEDATGN